jgi:hypothetical protein
MDNVLSPDVYWKLRAKVQEARADQEQALRMQTEAAQLADRAVTKARQAVADAGLDPSTLTAEWRFNDEACTVTTA